jgi:phosphotransferase system enzyme I (PtsI)
VLSQENSIHEIILKGTPVCRGIAIGKPFFFSFVEDEIPEYSIDPELIESEVLRYRDALNQSRIDISNLRSQLEKTKNREGAAILEAQLIIMEEANLTSEIESKIQLTKKNAESIFQAVIESYRTKFNSISNAFFRERFKDIQDISRRVIGHLRAASRHTLSNLPPDSIIFTKELSASETAEAHVSCASAFVTRHGGTNSHAAIVAKARGTPYVSNIPFEELECRHHNTVIVDGRTGEIIFSPNSATLIKYQQLKLNLQLHLNKLEKVNTLKAETYDGYTVRISANIEMASELEMLHQHGGHGVGLFRSEYICLSRNAFPSEEEQYQIYQDLVAKMQGLPIVIRTFDVGGDKGMPTHKQVPETNPFLGCRAIRFLLKEKEIFKNQLRAILRVSSLGEVSIMFPMVSMLSELIDAKQVLHESRLELEAEGIQVGKVRIGCMIEVPSAAMIADLLAKECDFLSIGTNDLVQYALAIDRSNQDIGVLYTPVHPSVIRMIKLIVQEANHHGIPVTICGEMAADPRFTPLLLGLGVHELSVSTRYIPIVKNTIRNTSIISASLLAEKVLSLPSSNEIQELLANEYRKINPEDCFYNC